VSDQTGLRPLVCTRTLGFRQEDKTGVHLIAAVVEGNFESYFKGQQSPLLENPVDDTGIEKIKEDTDPVITTVIDQSSSSARIIIFASNEFLADQTLQISRSTGSDRFINSLQIIENSIDWSLEDRGLLSIRSRGQFSRTLKPLTDKKKMFYEYLNYGLMLIGLILIFIIQKILQGRSKRYLAAMFK